MVTKVSLRTFILCAYIRLSLYRRIKAVVLKSFGEHVAVVPYSNFRSAVHVLDSDPRWKKICLTEEGKELGELGIASFGFRCGLEKVHFLASWIQYGKVEAALAAGWQISKGTFSIETPLGHFALNLLGHFEHNDAFSTDIQDSLIDYFLDHLRVLGRTKAEEVRRLGKSAETRLTWTHKLHYVFANYFLRLQEDLPGKELSNIRGCTTLQKIILDWLHEAWNKRD